MRWKETIMSETGRDPTVRDDVANFASYCVGSCYRDWDPRVDREYERVMHDDRVLQVWRERMPHYHVDHFLLDGHGEYEGTPVPTDEETTS
jgi:hypothetical protein